MFIDREWSMVNGEWKTKFIKTLFTFQKTLL